MSGGILRYLRKSPEMRLRLLAIRTHWLPLKGRPTDHGEIDAYGAICGLRLGRLHRGDDHHGAVDLLRSAVPDGQKLAAQLQRLLSLKDAAHYGIVVISARNTADAKRWATQIVERATEESER